MIKIIGIILVIGGAAAMGLSARARLTLRIRVLSAFSSGLDTMHSEITCMLTPISELLIKLRDTAPEPVRVFYENCIQSAACRTDMPISLIWNRAIKDADYLELKSHERQILIDMGASLGRFEADEQGSVIMHARRAIDNCLKAAEADKLRMGKLYGSLGVVCGLAVVIMLL